MKKMSEHKMRKTNGGKFDPNKTSNTTESKFLKTLRKNISDGDVIPANPYYTFVIGLRGCGGGGLCDYCLYF